MNSKTASAPPRRSYHSAVRSAKKGETRQQILDALVAKMVKEQFGSVSMEEIAAAAGVGPATLYRHFPNRESLWDGLSGEFNRRVGGTVLPTTPAEISEMIRRDFAAMDQHPGLVQVFFRSELGRKARSRGRARRLAAIRRSLDPVTRGLGESQKNQVTAVIAYLASLQGWVTMTSEFGLTGADVGQAASWAIETLLADVTRPRAHGKTTPAQ